MRNITTVTTADAVILFLWLWWSKLTDGEIVESRREIQQLLWRFVTDKEMSNSPRRKEFFWKMPSRCIHSYGGARTAEKSKEHTTVGQAIVNTEAAVWWTAPHTAEHVPCLPTLHLHWWWRPLLTVEYQVWVGWRLVRGTVSSNRDCRQDFSAWLNWLLTEPRRTPQRDREASSPRRSGWLGVCTTAWCQNYSNRLGQSLLWDLQRLGMKRIRDFLTEVWQKFRSHLSQPWCTGHPVTLSKKTTEPTVDLWMESANRRLNSKTRMWICSIYIIYHAGSWSRGQRWRQRGGLYLRPTVCMGWVPNIISWYSPE